MKKLTFLILVCLLLGACATATTLPENPPQNNPTESPVAPPTAQPTDTIPVQSSTPTIAPTPAPTAIPRPESAIPLMAPGQVLTLDQVKLETGSTGWATAKDADNNTHILISADNGGSWTDVTPPETAATSTQDGKHALAFFGDPQSAWVAYWTNDQNTGPSFSDQIWYTQDGGMDWQASQPLDLSDWQGGYSQPVFIDFPDSMHGFLALGHDPGMSHRPMSIYRTTDGGQTWELARPAMDEAGRAIDVCCQTGMAFLDGKTGIMTMDPGPIGKTYWVLTSDGGTTWTMQDTPPQSQSIYANGLCKSTNPDPLLPGTLYVTVDCLQEAVSGQAPPAYLFITTDGGDNWSSTSLPDIPWDQAAWTYVRRNDQVQMIDAQDGWLLTNIDYENADSGQTKTLAKLYNTSDGGKSWQEVNDFTNQVQISFLDVQNGWLLVSGEPPQLNSTSDGGNSWTTIEPKLIGSVTSTATQPSNPSTPKQPTIAHYQPGIALVINQVQMINDQTGWAISSSPGPDDHLLITSDGGQTWEDVTPPEPASPSSNPPKSAIVFFLDQNNAWATYFPQNQPGSESEPVWSTHNSGIDWQSSQPLPQGTIEELYYPRFIDFINSDLGWLMMGHGAAAGSAPVTIYQTQDGGATWKFALEMLSPDSGSINTCCQSGMLFATPEQGLITTSFGPDPSAQVNWSQDGGASWQRQNLPLPSGTSDQAGCATFSPAQETGGKVSVVVECQDYSQNSPATHGYLFVTSDSGANWTTDKLPEPTPEVNLQFTGQRDWQFMTSASSAGWLVVKDHYTLSNGQGEKVISTLYQTQDGGKNWQLVSHVSWDGQFSFTENQNGWAVARDGDQIAFVTSKDGGRSWQIIQPNTGP